MPYKLPMLQQIAGFNNLRRSGLIKVMQGVTSLTGSQSCDQ